MDVHFQVRLQLNILRTTSFEFRPPLSLQLIVFVCSTVKCQMNQASDRRSQYIFAYSSLISVKNRNKGTYFGGVNEEPKGRKIVLCLARFL